MRDKRRTKLLIGVIGLFLIFAVITDTTYADYGGPIDTINYQGYLATSGSSPVTGTRDIMFKIYRDPGGEIWTYTYRVTVSNGIFSVILGQGSDALASAILSWKLYDLYVGVTVCQDDSNPCTSWDPEMSPRQLLTAVPYAIRARDADDSFYLQTHPASYFATSSHGHLFSDMTNSATDTQIPDTITINYAATDSSATTAVNADNADLLDGFSSASFMFAGTDNWVNTTGDTMTGPLSIGNTDLIKKLYVYTSGNYAIYGEAANYAVYGKATTPSGIGVYGLSLGADSLGVVGNGTLFDFYAGGGSGYGPFTGGHEVNLHDNFPEDIKPGMVVSVTGKTHIRKSEEGMVSISSTLPTVALSKLPYDKTVFGVFVMEAPLPKEHWYHPNEGERFGIANALGEGRVWVSNINGDIQAGDYITTSSIPGYGQMQDDDLLHSYTLGKAIETVHWNSVTETVEYSGETYKVYLIAVVYTSG